MKSNSTIKEKLMTPAPVQISCNVCTANPTSMWVCKECYLKSLNALNDLANKVKDIEKILKTNIEATKTKLDGSKNDFYLLSGKEASLNEVLKLIENNLTK